MREMNSLILRSSIKPALKRTLLLRGTLLAFIGMSLLLSTGISSIEQKWGLLALITALVLVTTGLLPYRRLTRLEMNPHEILITENGICFSRRRKPCFTVPQASIDRMEYRDSLSQYGFAFWLKNAAPEKVTIHDRSFDWEKFTQQCLSQYGCAVFIPYFSKRSFDEMQEFLA